VPELPTHSETPEVGLERKISGNLDIRKKESWRPMQKSEADAKSETGTDVQDGKPEPSCGRCR
jgi:hypothetical protein